MEDWKQKSRSFWVIFSLPTFWMVLFFLIPMGMIWVFSFGEKQGIIDIAITGTLDNYARVFEPIYLQIFLRSFLIGALVTLICLAIGLPLALMIVYADKRWQSILLLLIILPFWTNLLIRTYALIAVLRTRGYVNDVYEWFYQGAHTLLGWIASSETADNLLGARFQPLELLYNDAAVIIGLVYVHLPFMVLPLYAAIERMDKSFIEASLDLGASHLQSFFKIIVPLSMPGIISGIVITFIPVLGSYLTPALLGGTDSLMIANVIERQFKDANHWPFGAALSFLLMYITFGILAFRAYFNRHRKAEEGM